MALTATPAAGAKLRGSILSSLLSERLPIYAQKSADQNVGPSNTTLQDVTEVGIAVVANAIYKFEMSFQYSTNTTADIKLGFTFPTGLTMDIAGEYYSVAEAYQTARGTQATVFTMGGSGAAALFLGTVTVAANAGTLQLQAAQNTSTAVTTNVEAGTLMVLTRIG